MADVAPPRAGPDLPPTPARVPAVTLRRAAVGAPTAARTLPAWLRRALEIPLTAKVVGANAMIVVAATLAHAIASPGLDADAAIFLGALTLALTVNCLLVRVALRPLRDLERTATRVWRGDFDARVPPSPVADVEVARLGRTVNLLLDALESDRGRMRGLAAQTIRAQDDERARIARELHDSTAQTLAAVTYQLAAAARDSRDPELAGQLAAARTLLGDALEEVRAMSHTIHPRLLDDLGLFPAIEWLARQTRERAGLAVDVRTAGDAAAVPLSKEAATALYRVGQESLRNVERHAGARRVCLTVVAAADAVILDVEDDGCGFDPHEAESRRPGMGLFSMRERLALVDGALDIDTAPGRGTRIRAQVPVVA